MFPLTTKRVYDPSSPADGTRVLVMRFWPRGVPRSSIDHWFRELGAGPDLIKKWKQEAIRWTEFRRSYLRGLQDPAARQAISEIRGLLAKSPVTLLCSCPEEARCHRSILRKTILQQTGTIRIAAKRQSRPSDPKQK